MTLYLKTTKDKYELPEAVAESGKELASMVGITVGSFYTFISKKKKGYYKVEVDEDAE